VKPAYLGTPEETLDLLASLLATSPPDRRQRLQRLPERVLVELTALLLNELESPARGEGARLASDPRD
jgi:hypothetical protein